MGLALLLALVAAGGPARAAALDPALHGSIRAVRTGEKAVALTFDLCEGAGETAGYDAALVGYLREHGIRATFFAGGKWLKSHPEQARQLLNDPLFEVGSHAWSHGNLRQLDGRARREEIDRAEAVLAELRRALPAAPPDPPLFRFPYGACSAEALAEVNRRGLAAIQWDIVTGDPDRRQDAAAIARTVLREIHPGAIVIAHANGRGWHTAAALPLFVPKLQALGYRFVTVGELLRLGDPLAVADCYERHPGDNRRYDRRGR